MGWASNGVYSGSQAFAWPALLRFGGGGAISLPLIQDPGCISPFLPPLGANKRRSGEPWSGSFTCAPNEPGVQLPTQDLGLALATTLDVLQTVPEAVALTAPFFLRVLPLHTTVLQAALIQHPTVVSVELGANEVLGASSGLAVVGVTIFPEPLFEQLFGTLLGAVLGAHVPNVMVVGVPTDGRNFANFRRGDEVWADRAEFAALGVLVSPNCNGSQNYINVSIKSIALAFMAAGSPGQVFSCANVPGQQDLVLTPDEMNLVNATLQAMAAFQKQQAAAAGYAFFSLDELFGRSDLKPPVYSVISQLTSAHPYGPYISLDGLHPSPLGQSILAKAAAQALNKAYPGIAAHSVNVPPAFGELLVEPSMPVLDAARATQMARQNLGQAMPTCMIPGGCLVRMPQAPR
jgi:lysophospholipase L1-like esterase